MSTNRHESSINTFIALIRAGLFPVHGEGVMVHDSLFKDVDWEKVYQLAQEQSVQGLVLEGIEELRTKNLELRVPQGLLLQWIGEVQMIEQRNKAMNLFVADLIEKLQSADIYALLVKGQGIAQCYEKPLWRSCGDVDLLLSDSNYSKAKDFLLPLSTGNKPDERYSKHLGMNIDKWYVEIHGTLRTGLSGRIDKEVDDVQRDVFYKGNVRSIEFKNSKGTSVQVFLPAPSEDVFFVFTHFIKHFYKEGMNLRQICDWCRLIWTYRDSLNYELLEQRIKRAGLMNEWLGFAIFAVDYLGMPVEAMPLFNDNNNENKKLHKKSERLLKHILKGGPYSKVRDTWAIFKIFPWNTIKFLPSIFLNINGLKIRERLFG